MKLSCLLLASLVMAIISPSLGQGNAFENRARLPADEPRRLMMMMMCKTTKAPTKAGKGMMMTSKPSKTCAPVVVPTFAPTTAAPTTAAPTTLAPTTLTPTTAAPS